MSKYQANFLNTGKWWVAWTDDLPGALTQGKTIEEARENLGDAIRLMLTPTDTDSVETPSTELVRETLEV